jgi:iron complex transport system substrate-binding protein
MHESKQVIVAFFLMFLGLVYPCGAQRVVSTDGTLSEIVCGLGLESHLVGVDVTSTYPASLKKLKQIGHNRTISAEGILSLNPDLILVNGNAMINPNLVRQLKQTGKRVVVFNQEYSVDGAKNLIREVGKTFNKAKEAEGLVKKIDRDLAQLKRNSNGRKILFVYARGAGTIMVAGVGTQVDQMIKLSGNENAAKGFSAYKPLTSEALLAANPDYFLLFEDGLASLGGIDGLLKIPGVSYTNAGKNKKVIQMDGLYLMSFGPRVGAALVELASKSR